jgi:hypothetical protein
MRSDSVRRRSLSVTSSICRASRRHWPNRDDVAHATRHLGPRAQGPSRLLRSARSERQSPIAASCPRWKGANMTTTVSGCAGHDMGALPELLWTADHPRRGRGAALRCSAPGLA